MRDYSFGNFISTLRERCGLGLVVETDSSASIKTPIEKIQKSTLSNNDIMNPMFNVFKRENYELTSFGKGFVHLINDKRKLNNK